MVEQIALQRKLSEVFSEMKRRNPAYSLRAFARRLDLSPSTVSEILNGKRRVSRKLTEKISDRLCFSPKERHSLLKLFPEKKRGFVDVTNDDDYMVLSMDQYHIVSDWYYFAIVSLSETEDWRDDPHWIARRLNIGVQETRVALERLERMGLMKRDENGRYRHSGNQFSSPDENVGLRKGHYQDLKLLEKSLDTVDLSKRDFTNMTMAIDPDKIPQAKRLIRDFEDRMCKFLESGRKREVYKICVQLVPLTIRQEFMLGEKELIQ